jgi:hypothetical protein
MIAQETVVQMKGGIEDLNYLVQEGDEGWITSGRGNLGRVGYVVVVQLRNGKNMWLHSEVLVVYRGSETVVGAKPYRSRSVAREWPGSVEHYVDNGLY